MLKSITVRADFFKNSCLVQDVNLIVAAYFTRAYYIPGSILVIVGMA